MITQAYLRKGIISRWLQQEIQDSSTKPDLKDKLRKLILSEQEWYHVRMIASILKPLAGLTDLLSRSREPLIHRFFIFYNKILDGLENNLAKYQEISSDDPRFCADIVPAIKAMIEKLEQYYSRTDGPAGLLYNLATILDPSSKLCLYKVGFLSTKIFRGVLTL